MRFLSDLAVEFGSNFNDKDIFTDYVNLNNVGITKLDLTKKSLAQKLGKRQGVYYTLESNKYDADIENAIVNVLDTYEYDWTKVLFVGLGNPSYEADALGTYVLDKIKVVEDKVYKIYPMTSRKTGIESIDIIKCVTRLVKPTLVVAIDALSTLNANRLGLCYQLSSAGIVPGSGVGNSRVLIDKKSLGVDVLAIGVPLVLNLRKYSKKSTSPNLIVTPSSIDKIVFECANNISNGINRYLSKYNII